MGLNKDEFTKFFQSEFNGNYNECGRALGISPGQIHRVVNRNGSKAGLVFLNRLINYCQDKCLDYTLLISLDETSSCYLRRRFYEFIKSHTS